MELSGEFPVKLLCETMDILRSSFYSWKKHLSNPSDRTKNLVSNILLFKELFIRIVVDIIVGRGGLQGWKPPI